MSKQAVEHLLRVMEARSNSLQLSALRLAAGRATDMLLNSDLLVKMGNIPVVAGMDDYEDAPLPLSWGAETKSYGYRDSLGRWIRVADAEIAACTVSYAQAITKMLVQFERAGTMQAVSKDLIWDLGTIRIRGAKAPVPVWFARRLSEPQVWAELERLMTHRPALEKRIILTSTSGAGLPETNQKRNYIINVTDVADDPNKLAISSQLLAARVFPEQAQRRYPIDHSEDCGLVWYHGETLTFGGDKQRILLQLLFDAYWSAIPVLRVAAVLEEAGYGPQVNSLAKAFSGRDDWRAFIKYADGNCWVEP